MPLSPNLATGLSYLQRLGARVGPIVKVSGAGDIAQMVPHNGSVVMFAVKLVKNGLVTDRHALYAFRNIAGQVRFMDRTVGRPVAAGTQGVYTKLEDIARLYGATFEPYEAAVVFNVFVKFIGFEVPKLVIPVLGVIAVEDGK
jgi:hypothetical protein